MRYKSKVLGILKSLSIFIVFLSVTSIDTSAQDYILKDRRSKWILQFYNFKNDSLLVNSNYQSLHKDINKTTNGINLYVSELFENENLIEVNLEIHNLIIEAYTIMKLSRKENRYVEKETPDYYKNQESKIYYVGDLNISNTLTTKLFIRHIDYGDPFYSLEEFCIVSNNKNILSISVISIDYVGDFGCCNIVKCTLSNKNVFHVTSVICGHLPQTKGRFSKRMVKPYHIQNCINFRINKTTGVVQKMIRING